MIVHHWLQMTSDALLLAGMMIGTWEFGEFMTPWIGRWGFGLATMMVPWGLFLSGYSTFSVPWCIFAVGLITVWLWEPWDIALPSSGSFILGWAVTRSTFLGVNVPFAAGGLTLLVFVMLGSILRKWFQKSFVFVLISQYIIAIGLEFLFGILYADPNMKDDIIRSVILLVMVSIYTVFRTHRRQLQYNLKLRASHDYLTKALTRYGLEQWLIEQRGATGTVLALDLDNFKQFNDTWGHTVGDQVLQTVTARIRSICRPCDAIVRPGGDEFTVWVRDLSGIEEARAVAYQIHDGVSSEAFIVAGGSWPIYLSVGWAVGSLTMETAEMADQALLQAKRRGKNQVVGMGDSTDPGDSMNASYLTLAAAADQLWSVWSDAAVLTDTAGQIVATNLAYEKLVGKTRGELIGQNPSINSAGQTPKSVIIELWKHLGQGDSWRGLFLNQHSDGSLWWAYEYIQPVLGEEQQILGYWANINPLFSKRRRPSVPTHAFDGIAITPVYQPIVHLSTGEVLGYEVLSRPQIGNYAFSPDELFALATALDQVSMVDIKCLESFVNRHQLQKWGNEMQDMKWFVNVRAETLTDVEKWRSIAKRLANVVGPSALVWEISEKGGQDCTITQIPAELREESLGAWAIDDWGAGHHPLSRIEAVAPQWIKVDRGWVQSAMTDQTSRSLLLHLLQWAQDRGILTVAEGVETIDQVDQVINWGFYAGQGYFWGRPSAEFYGTVQTTT